MLLCKPSANEKSSFSRRESDNSKQTTSEVRIGSQLSHNVKMPDIKTIQMSQANRHQVYAMKYTESPEERIRNAIKRNKIYDTVPNSDVN